MRLIPAVCLATLPIWQSLTVASQQPMSKGSWAYRDGQPESVTFDYGTELSAEDMDRLSAFDSIAQIQFGFASIDSEYVTIKGGLLPLGRLKKLRDVHLNKDGIHDDDLKFVALLPEIHTLEFNADNGYDGAPICTDRCAKHLTSATTLRELSIHDGQFTDKFVEKIVKGLPKLEKLVLNSPELTDESLRFIGEQCRNLKVLHIASDHFTSEGLKHLDALPNLKRSVSSPKFRKRNSDVADEDLIEPYDGRCMSPIPPEAIAHLLDDIIEDHRDNVVLTLVRHPKPATQTSDRRTAWVFMVEGKPYWVINKELPNSLSKAPGIASRAIHRARTFVAERMESRRESNGTTVPQCLHPRKEALLADYQAKEYGLQISMIELVDRETESWRVTFKPVNEFNRGGEIWMRFSTEAEVTAEFGR